MRTLSKTNVIQLMADYDKAKRNLETIQVQMSAVVRDSLIDGQLAESIILSQVETCLVQAKGILEDYTVGFSRFSRSVSKSQNTDKPDEAFLENVRTIRLDAVRILQDFKWTLNHLKQQIILHNMALGNFSAVVPTAASQEQQISSTANVDNSPAIILEDQEPFHDRGKGHTSSVMNAQGGAGSVGTDKLPERPLGGQEE